VNRVRYIWRYVRNVRKLPLKPLDFISVLTHTNSKEVNKYWVEIDKLAKRYEIDLSEYHKAIYCIVRIVRPEKFVETGVFHGHSSFSILLALHKNSKGKLYSIDLPSQDLPEGKSPGWIIPDFLRDRWELYLGKSSDILEGLLEELGLIDVFLHDSEHSYDNMLWEYRTAYPFIRGGGLMLSHDISQNPAFRDFSKEVNSEYYYMLNNLAGLRKPE